MNLINQFIFLYAALCPCVLEIVLLKQSHKKCRLEISAYNLNLSKETVCKFFACYSQLLARSATLFETIQSGHVVVCTLEFLINKQHSYFRKFFPSYPFFRIINIKSLWERSLMASDVFWPFLTYLPTLSYPISSDFWGYL